MGLPFELTVTKHTSADAINSSFLFIFCSITNDDFETLFIDENILNFSSNFAGFLYSMLHDLTTIIIPNIFFILVFDNPNV